jgi:trk system potassium uptake protein TrkH
MIGGALPFVAYIRMNRGQPLSLWRDPQVRTFLVFLLLAGFAMGAWLSVSRDLALIDGLRLAYFNIVSVVTTTGYATDDYGAWGPLAVGSFLFLMFVGGCTGSTAGSIKVYRYQVLRILIDSHLKVLARPRRIVSLNYFGKPLPQDVAASVLAFVSVFFGVIAAFTMVLSAMGMDLLTALSASATAITNVGPGLGPIVGPAGNFASLPDAAKWLLCAAMLMGRLELFTVLVLLHPDFWKG